MSDLVRFIDGCPHCINHGAMNRVSKHGMWRCLICHVGYDEIAKRILKDSTEGFKKKGVKRSNE